MFDKAVIEEVKRRTNIATLVGRVTSLKRSGKNLIGLCPFHAEKNPSFSVNEVKGVYYCFGCQANGDAITFLMKTRGLSFEEAVEDLAREAGVPLPARVVSSEYAQKRDHRRRLEALQAVVTEFYHKLLLKSSLAAEARAYLEKRKIGSLAIAEFQLGFAPNDWHVLADFLKRKGHDLGLALELGLLHQKTDYYDAFRNRILFPIADRYGSIIGFGGRALSDEDKPKYLNSPETLLFKKGQTLYGLPQAIPAMSREGFAIVVEGYVDLIALWQAGVRNVVAPLGTALTREHLELVQHYASHLVFLFDGDAAGERAAERAVDLVIEMGVTARMVRLEDGLDPDEFVHTHGIEAMRERLRKAEPLVGYFLDRAWRQAPKDTPGIAQWVQQSLQTVAKLRDTVERSLYLRMIADRSNMTEKQLRQEVAARLVASAETRRANESFALGGPLRRMASLPVEEVLIVKLLLHYPQLVRPFRNITFVDKFTDPRLRRAAAILLEYDPPGEESVRELPESIYADEELAGLIRRFLVEPAPEFVSSDAIKHAYVDSCVHVYLRFVEALVREARFTARNHLPIPADELARVDQIQRVRTRLQSIMQLRSPAEKAAELHAQVVQELLTGGLARDAH